jgi:RNA-binding protein
MSLSSKQKRYLRSLAHTLKPVVMVGGSGLSAGVINEANDRLEHHELIKVRISGAERSERVAMSEALAAETNSEVVNTIGHITVLYRRSKKPQIQLPN